MLWLMAVHSSIFNTIYLNEINSTNIITAGQAHIIMSKNGQYDHNMWDVLTRLIECALVDRNVYINF